MLQTNDECKTKGVIEKINFPQGAFRQTYSLRCESIFSGMVMKFGKYLDIDKSFSSLAIL